MRSEKLLATLYIELPRVARPYFRHYREHSCPFCPNSQILRLPFVGSENIVICATAGFGVPSLCYADC